MSDHQSRRDQFCQSLVEHSIACAILTLPHDVAYLTGHHSGWGDSPSLLIVAPDQTPVIVTPDHATRPFTSDDGSLQIRLYESSCLQQPVEPHISLARQVADVLRLWRTAGKTVGVEVTNTPHFLIEFLELKISDLETYDVTDMVRQQRAIKTEREILALRESARVASLGQETCRRLCAEGKSEIEVFSGVRATMEAEVGEPLKVGGEVTLEPRTGDRRRGPTKEKLHPGSVVVSHLATCVGGYWADTCITISLGDPPAEIRKAHKSLCEALELGLEALSPGVLASEVDRVVREHLQRCGFGCDLPSGHGIGVTHLEDPMIVPYNTKPLARNMVLTLEPEVEVPGLGRVRLEHSLLITENGTEVLSLHSTEL